MTWQGLGAIVGSAAVIVWVVLAFIDARRRPRTSALSGIVGVYDMVYRPNTYEQQLQAQVVQEMKVADVGTGEPLDQPPVTRSRPC